PNAFGMPRAIQVWNLEQLASAGRPLQLRSDEHLREHLQVHAFAVAARDLDREAKGVRVANRFRGSTAEDAVRYRDLADLGQVAFAQAEYYYHGPGEASEWLWRPAWRARLRRFRLPPGITGAQLAGACATQGTAGSAGCSAVVRLDFD